MRPAQQSLRGQRKQHNQEGRDIAKAEWDMPEPTRGFAEYKGVAPPTNKAKQDSSAKKTITKEEMKVSEGKAAQAFEYKEHKTLTSLRLVTLSNKGV